MSIRRDPSPLESRASLKSYLDGNAAGTSIVTLLPTTNLIVPSVVLLLRAGFGEPHGNSRWN